jgi:hypothetical protein
MRAHLDTLKQLTEAERRNFSTLTISYKAPLYDTGIASPDGSRRLFSGESEHCPSSSESDRPAATSQLGDHFSARR